ncbi:hypothetical protein [Bacillus sp. V3-13]|uniref:hypothetical protein n=1 Tax=Bacillus sp. V3-13 TaxID=2053728 RepID=UPI0015E0FE86|nr:hypothetical protein [Bacillus sp. V3-13]
MDLAGSWFPLVAFIPFILYLGIFIFGIWFAITLIRTLKEKNQILKEITMNIEQRNKE